MPGALQFFQIAAQVVFVFEQLVQAAREQIELAGEASDGLEK